MDFTRGDDDITLCISPTKYIDKLVKNYEKSFGHETKYKCYISIRKREGTIQNLIHLHYALQNKLPNIYDRCPPMDSYHWEL
jgi:hypothetical protein